MITKRKVSDSMNANPQGNTETRPLDVILKQQLDNTITCRHALYELFTHLAEPLPHIANVKRLEGIGDKLTAEAYNVLEAWELNGITQITEELIRYLDDIVDGFNKTAQLIDIFQSQHIEDAAFDILTEQQAMLERLKQEVDCYPNNELANLRACCTALKQREENVDTIYHEWRRKERRILELSLIEESNWTEIFGVLEQTTDDLYHTALVLEKLTKYRIRGIR